MASENGAKKKVKLIAAVLLLEMLLAGFHVVSRVALNMGVSKMAFLVYRNASALAVVAPFAYFLEKKDRPPLTLRLMGEFFVLAALGAGLHSHGLYILGLYYLAPTYVSAMQNSIPAITFVMAAALRIEQFNIKSIHSLAKIAGTAATIAGATIITLYKGMLLAKHSEGIHKQKDISVILSPGFTWIAGCLIMCVNCLCLSAWMVLQVPVLKKYPAKLSSFAITLALGLIQLIAVAPFFESNIERWKVQSGGELFTILYVGIVVLGLAWNIKIWCISKGGPLFVAAFQPLQTVMVVIMAAIFLGDRLYTGGVIGAVIIAGGLYCVLWAKSKETTSNNDLFTERSSLAQNLLHEESTYENP